MIPSRGRALLLLAFILGGCDKVDCSEPQNQLAEAEGQALSCAQAEVVPRYLSTVAGRGLPSHQKERVLEALRDRFRADPAATRLQLEGARKVVEELSALRGLEVAERRSQRAWEAASGSGPLGAGEDIGTFTRSLIGVWARDDSEKLLLTEIDIEGWIRYASLCREAQGGSPIVVSVADRHTIYRVVTERYRAASREEQVAMSAIGPFWYAFRTRWQAASYEQQQAWIASAPLPPPMTATSLGYLEALTGTDVRRHAEVLHLLWPDMRLEPR